MLYVIYYILLSIVNMKILIFVFKSYYLITVKKVVFLRKSLNHQVLQIIFYTTIHMHAVLFIYCRLQKLKMH